MKGITTAIIQRSPPSVSLQFSVENTPKNGNLAKATTNQSKLYQSIR